MITGSVRALILDIDGVLAPPHFLLHDSGEVGKFFSVRDGLGIKLVKDQGIEVLLLTSRSDPVNTRRAQELGIEILMCSGRKADKLKEWLNQKGINPREVVYVGDDLVDREALQTVGWPVAVGDASPALKAIARRVTRARGGEGAVREVCEWLLKQKLKTP